jgi:hypothetical protein
VLAIGTKLRRGVNNKLKKGPYNLIKFPIKMFQGIALYTPYHLIIS